LKRSKVQKTLVKDGKIEVVENSRFMTEARQKEQAETERGVHAGSEAREKEVLAASSSSSPHGRVRGSCRRCDSTACSRA
jgi:hypothetical protein